MDAIEERAEMQLRVIEQLYSIEIKNKKEVALIIAKKASNKKQVLKVCTSLNYWAAANKIKGTVIIPSDVVLRILERL